MQKCSAIPLLPKLSILQSLGVRIRPLNRAPESLFTAQSQRIWKVFATNISLKDCVVVEPSGKGARDDKPANKLWEVTLKLVGLEK